LETQQQNVPKVSLLRKLTMAVTKTTDKPNGGKSKALLAKEKKEARLAKRKAKQ